MNINDLDITPDPRAAIEEMNARRGDKAMLALWYVLATGFIVSVALLVALSAVVFVTVQS